MKIIFKSTTGHIQPDWGFTLYFVGMFCLYKFTYIQLSLQLFIIGYVFVKKLTQSTTQNVVKMSLSRTKINDLIFFLIWLGIIAAMLYISGETYAVYKFRVTTTALTTFRIFVIGFIIFYYVDSKEMALSVAEAFVIGAFAMSITVMLITPPSAYFVANSESGFGAKIAHHRNQVAASCATGFILSYYLGKYAKFKGGYLIAAFLAIVTILSGSRGGILELAIGIILILFLNGNFVALFFILVSGAIILTITYNVPILHDNIWVRFINAADTMGGEVVSDKSTLAREYYKEIAWMMFKRRPIIGYGVDGFKGYLATHPIYKGEYLPMVYSHCNFSELMSCLGIVGLLSWYIPTFIILITSLVKIGKNKFFEMSFVLLFSLIILDYARIPWSTHFGTYPYIIMFILIRNMSREYPRTKKKITNINTAEDEKIEIVKQDEIEAIEDDVHFTIVAKEEID